MDLLKRAKVLSVNLSWVECAFVCKKTYQLKNSLMREKSIVKYQVRGKSLEVVWSLSFAMILMRWSQDMVFVSMPSFSFTQEVSPCFSHCFRIQSHRSWHLPTESKFSVQAGENGSKNQTKLMRLITLETKGHSRLAQTLLFVAHDRKCWDQLTHHLVVVRCSPHVQSSPMY